ncbi:leader peptidase (prepilin peptidase)/N-methyltransferase [Povalibacter uvarum]|uniref:Prepilin leader peptidase/N-methyltransferase n=1 Tax=Povalibacter uvarum TaxID=732238 RepID=A0A841HQ68_9GAMM|nr:A24 family peptidase [Povalibacter uvarum]MBB6094913.1 leader peptidase (prepilin peptidase)/N-methyltransferase [Povalibacter uvarum]
MQHVLDLLIYGLTTSSATWIGLVFVFGLMIGSFLNVVIHRVPIMLDREWKDQARQILTDDKDPQLKPDAQPNSQSQYNLFVPRSACPKCGALITASQNIPVISYLFLKGKCAKCGTKISPRYPVVELATAVLSAAVAWKFGFHWYAGAALLLTWFLVALTVIDFDTQLLPDNMTLPLVWIGLVISLAPADPRIGLPVDAHSSIIGAVAGYLSLWSVYWAFKLFTGKEGMGYGDFKLFAALGAWLGWKMLPLIILLSAFTGAAVGIALIVVRGRDRNIPIPFGPYLAAAGWIALMWGDQIIGTYLHMSGFGPRM